MVNNQKPKAKSQKPTFRSQKPTGNIQKSVVTASKKAPTTRSVPSAHATEMVCEFIRRVSSVRQTCKNRKGEHLAGPPQEGVSQISPDLARSRQSRQSLQISLGAVFTWDLRFPGSLNPRSDQARAHGETLAVLHRGSCILASFPADAALRFDSS